MKMLKWMRNLGVVLLTASVLFGCASAQKEEAAAAAPVEKKPSVAERAIARAKAAIKRTDDIHALWRDTKKILKKAEKALKKGDEQKAIKLANEAKAQADLAYEQHMAEMRAFEERQAKEAAKPSTYEVVNGDSLWAIAALEQVYADPYLWPLLYKANHGQINDADLIYPGQVLTINRDATHEEMQAAINHAKTRGPWSLGVVEESDKAYLAR
jgi:nucleoid-associated protein YgaU